MAKPGKSNPFLNGFLVGLFAGLALAIVVVLMVSSSNPFVEKGLLQGSSGQQAGTPAEAPKYDFYQSLPQGAADGAPVPDASNPIYFLQAGAYGNAADADAVKARLALLGFEAKVLNSREGEAMLHKVRIGPYKSLDELNIARARLTQGGMETILVKIPPQQQEIQ